MSVFLVNIARFLAFQLVRLQRTFFAALLHAGMPVMPPINVHADCRNLRRAWHLLAVSHPLWPFEVFAPSPNFSCTTSVSSFVRVCYRAEGSVNVAWHAMRWSSSCVSGVAVAAAPLCASTAVYRDEKYRTRQVGHAVPSYSAIVPPLRAPDQAACATNADHLPFSVRHHQAAVAASLAPVLTCFRKFCSITDVGLLNPQCFRGVFTEA